MKKIFSILSTFAFLLTILSFSNVPSAYAGPMLKLVTIEAKSPGQVKKLARMGIDISSVRKGPIIKGPRGIPTQTYIVEAVVSARDEKKLVREKFSWSDLPGKGPVKKIGEPYDVYQSFDAPKTGIKAQLNKIQGKYPHLCQLKTIGQSIQKRPMLAMGLTNEKIKGQKPQVLFVATHHAREWVATEMAMRLIKYLTANFGADARVTDLLNTVEVWVIPVGNPDGYQYTFTNERLWRKNLRDNDGDGEITLADGVDLNRNFSAHWGLDEEGSSSDPADGTYRGTAPNSEPETRAVVDFIEDNDFKFVISYHTHGNLILYPWGWQVQTRSLDDPIFVAQAGTDANPAIFDSFHGVGYDPGVGADLYTTNGDFTDWAYYALGIPAQTVEFTTGYDFRFPDDEAMVQTVFEDSLNFALCVAESAVDPAHPVSPVGIVAEDIYHTPVTQSNGPNQMIEVLARKGINLTLTASGGTATPFTEKLGRVYNDRSGTYYSRYVAFIEGQSVGLVDYSINAGGSTLGPFSYEVKSVTGNPILVVAAEDYSGEYPTYANSLSPNFLHYYTDALDAGGYPHDVWDVDADGVPFYPEVLSHYETVIWYTGDDYAATNPYLGVQEVEMNNLRDLLNYNSSQLLATGQDFSWLSVYYGWFPDDFFQYYLGGYMHIEGGGMGPDGPIDVIGDSGGPIFDGLTFSLHNDNGGDGADNQHYADSFTPTGYFLPHYDFDVEAWYDRTGIFDAHSGDYLVYSQQANMAFKRLGGTFTLPAGSPTLKFWVIYDIEDYWDYAFVEVAAAGTDNWTTLPDLNGLTTTDTGDSCAAGWVDQIHPFLAHYMDAACNPSGTTGQWHAFTARSGGWQQVEFDLSAYAGQTVEIYISYATDWATENLGAFVDDIELSGYPPEDFEAGMGAWGVSTAPGSEAPNNWLRREGLGYPEGPAIRSSRTLYLGFGLEAIDTAANRNEVMDRVMQYLGQ
ncbi:MAG: immune inhibitor A [Deltaproteobacteria bacterium]|nr:immune inhibitor A [Deltaproteobacteria bacterium]MBW2480721.1 immune inhibitor A [Deltaproteobacteria bacterium]